MLIFSDENDETKKYVFIHILRCCGRYVRKQIYKKFKTYFVFPEITSNPEANPVSSRFETDDQYIMHERYLQYKSYNLGQTKFVTFVRNPYDRLISAYYYYLLSIYFCDDQSKKNDFLDFLITPFQTLKEKTMNELMINFKANFKNYIKTEVENLKEDFNYILTPQYKFVVDENNQIPEDISIYKLEEYTPDSEPGLFFQFEDFNLKVYDHSEYFDNETLEIVNRKYSLDFELLGYNKISNIQQE
jgi:hypothetical protein